MGPAGHVHRVRSCTRPVRAIGGSGTRVPPSRGEASGTLLDIMCIIGNSVYGGDQSLVPREARSSAENAANVSVSAAPALTAFVRPGAAHVARHSHRRFVTGATTACTRLPDASRLPPANLRSTSLAFRRDPPRPLHGSAADDQFVTVTINGARSEGRALAHRHSIHGDSLARVAGTPRKHPACAGIVRAGLSPPWARDAGASLLPSPVEDPHRFDTVT